MHDKFYLIHKIDNTKGMEREDGGFTEGMLFVMLYDQGDAPPPHPPSIQALAMTNPDCALSMIAAKTEIKDKKIDKRSNIFNITSTYTYRFHAWSH